MKKLLVTLAVLGLFIGGSNLKGYDFFVVNDTNKKISIGVLMKNGEKIATITGRDLQRLYEKLIRERQEQVRKDIGPQGTEI